MVREGSVVKERDMLIRKICIAFALVLTVPDPVHAQPLDSAPKPTVEGIERLPYRIRVHLDVDSETRLDAKRRDALVADWRALTARFVGAPWQLEVSAESTPSPVAGDLDALDPEALAEGAAGFDKLWLVRVGRDGGGYGFDGREFDVSLRRLGPLQHRSAPVPRDAPRVFFQLSLDLFSPTAEIGEHFGKDVSLRVRAAALTPASSVGRVVGAGNVFLPLRIVPQKDGKALVREIAYTYLRVESHDGTSVRSSIKSMFSDPLTARVAQKTSLAAIGVKPGKHPTRLRFLTLPDRAPAAGYVLTMWDYPDGLPREVGTTDREGRITLVPGIAPGLVVFRLLAGTSEPMREFPLMPGESPSERVVPPFDPKPEAVTLETRLDALRDTVIDLVAVRARLEARLKARFDGEDWAEAKATLQEFNALPSREKFADALAKLKDEATRRQARSKTPILTKTAQSQLTDLQSLIDRYLDDESFKAFADALEKLEAAPKTKEKAKPKAAAK